MKKWLVHIIYRLFRFLFGGLTGDKVKGGKYQYDNDSFGFIVAEVVRGGAIWMFSFLWRQSVFRCGSSA